MSEIRCVCGARPVEEVVGEKGVRGVVVEHLSVGLIGDSGGAAAVFISTGEHYG